MIKCTCPRCGREFNVGSESTEIVYTTGQVAKLLKVAPRTVAKWFDDGRFKGAYLIPEGTDRRIPRPALVAYLRSRGITLTDDNRMIGVK